LEGVGLLHKTSKNNIQWKGGAIDGGPQPTSSSFQSESVIAKKIQMEMENARLEAKERELSELIELANNQLRDTHENPDYKRYAFVTYRDIRGIKEFSDQTVIAIKAPSETKLEVPDPREVPILPLSIYCPCLQISHSFIFCVITEPSNLVEKRKGRNRSIPLS